ncbi:MAG TPA: glycosyltransferase [Caulobacteraceae bacterium]|nr:glycosyltransferase [Caulobacteraceae bacterium]
MAIVHYWLVTMRGGERVLERLIRLFPEADIFTHVYDPSAVSELIRSRPVYTTFIQKLPGARRHYKKYLPLMPMALEELDLSAYDLVICSEAGPAKGVITAPDALQVCYCHSPMRYLWDQYPAYRATANPLARLAMPWSFHQLRQWDTSSAARVERFMANSNFIRKRIAKAYGRGAVVVHPPVDTALFSVAEQVERRWLWVGQMTPYKRADLAVEAFNALGLPLLMVGDGEMAKDVRRRAGPNITIVPRLGFTELRRAYAECKALIFTPEEDFGIVPVETMASGRPVLAYGRGGILDTVEPGETGLFFQEQTLEAVIDGVEQMEAWAPHFDPARAVQSARRFSPERFDANFLAALTIDSAEAERIPERFLG